MSAASRNDMVGLQKLENSLVEQIGEDAVADTQRRTIRSRLREMHAQGVVLEDAAEALGISVQHARTESSRLKLTFKTDAMRRRERRNEIIKDGFANGTPMADIAKAAGLSLDALRSVASRIGVTRTRVEIDDQRRGFSVPDHLKEDYRLLTSRGRYRPREAGIALGLLEAEQ